MTPDELREKMVEAMAQAMWKKPGWGNEAAFKWEETTEYLRDQYRLTARAALTAIERFLADPANGCKMVCRDMTEAMCEAGRAAMAPEKFVSHMRTLDVWIASHDAAPATPWADREREGR